jgi:hypothetical protein
MASAKWVAGVSGNDLTSLQAATSSATTVFKRMLFLLEADLQSSISRMYKDDVCSNHALISKEIGIQQECHKQIEMINQIIKE